LLQGTVVHGSQGAAAGDQDVHPRQSAEATRGLRQVGVRPAECDGEGGQGGSPLGPNVRQHDRGDKPGVCYHNGPDSRSQSLCDCLDVYLFYFK